MDVRQLKIRPSSEAPSAALAHSPDVLAQMPDLALGNLKQTRNGHLKCLRQFRDIVDGDVDGRELYVADVGSVAAEQRPEAILG
jgi:hypothetical protein